MSGLWVTVVGLNKIKDRSYRMGHNGLLLQGQCCQADWTSLAPLGALDHHEVKVNREDRQTVREIEISVCQNGFGCHLLTQHSTSCIHLIRLDEMTHLCSPLPGEVILEIKYVLLIMTYSASHRISYYRPLQLTGADSVT